MRLAADYVHPFESVSGIRSCCRIRLYLPEHEHEQPHAMPEIAAEVIETNWLVDPVWIEHHPEETTAAGIESFELVVFSDLKIREAVRNAGSRIEIGEPSWKPLDRTSVEVLLGQPLG